MRSNFSRCTWVAWLLLATPGYAGDKASKAALGIAITALQKEILVHANDSKISLRSTSNYFIDHPPERSIVPEVLVETLNTVFSADAPTDSYIKWQLLSGVPSKFKGDLAHEASVAYLNAGKPIPRPGLSMADKKELDAYLKQVRSTEDSVALTQKLTDLIEPWQTRNAPVLAYRDALYGRLPRNGEALVARLEDEAQRVEAGYESRKSMAALIEAIDKWIDTKPPALHLQIVADRVTAWMNRGQPQPIPKVIRGKIGIAHHPNYKRGKPDNGLPPRPFPPVYYEQVEYVPDLNFFSQLFRRGRAVASDEKQWHWSENSAQQVNGESLSDLVVTLEEYAKIAREAEQKAGKK